MHFYLFLYLFSMDYGLTKNEVVAFLNTLGKFSESLHYIHYFESLKAQTKPSPAPNVASNANTPPPQQNVK